MINFVGSLALAWSLTWTALSIYLRFEWMVIGPALAGLTVIAVIWWLIGRLE